MNIDPISESVIDPQPTGTSSKSLRILVVDDNEDAASMLAILFETLGHQVVVENHPTGGIEKAKLIQPQVCVLDIGLPDMDGYELVQRLRALPEAASALMIAVTGYGHENDRKKSSESGFDHHLVKPAGIDKL